MSGVFILLTNFLFFCYIITVHVPIPRQRQDVQLGHFLLALVSEQFCSLWKNILLQVVHLFFSIYWRSGKEKNI